MAELIFSIREQFEKVHGLADKGKLLIDDFRHKDLSIEDLKKLAPINMRAKMDPDKFTGIKEKAAGEQWEKGKPKATDVATGSAGPERSKKGLPFYSTDTFGRYYFLPVSLGAVELPLPVISVDTRKTIIETHMVNRTGSVKGYINTEDYRIRIKGICHRPDGRWPEEDINLLNELYKVNQSWPIDNALTSVLGIEHAVITNLTIMEPRGKAVGYTMDLLSDEPFTLLIES